MSSSRDPWLDNAKMALVTLVVVGHSWTLLPANTLDEHLYDFLYAWHVPAFVFVTGYLSRSFDYSPARMWLLVRTVAIPFVAFEAALALFRIYVGGERLADLWLDPHWPMWYLSALFLWRLLTPLFRPLAARVAVAAALAASLLLGAVTPSVLDLSRVVGLLPFFVLGLCATPERLARLRAPRVRLLAVPALALVWWLTSFTDSVARTEWFYYRSSYADLGADLAGGVLVRACVIAIGILGGAAFLALVPTIGGWFTRLGAMTLVVYLCHGFAVLGARYAGYEAFTAAHPGPALVLTTTAAVCLALALASRPVAGVLQHLVDPFGYAWGRVVVAARLAAVASTPTDRDTMDSDRAPEPVGADR